MERNIKSSGRLKYRFIYILNKFNILRKNIDFMTEIWLKENGFELDKLIIEKGNEHIQDPSSKIKNRFRISRNKKIRYFIEDDLQKAIKLAYICEIVLLIDHPYNKINPQRLPPNIIRVSGWQDIYKIIKEMA